MDLEVIIGPNSTDINWWQMLIRAITVFFVALLIVRLGGTRIFGGNTSFDIVLGIILGSVLSRAITGNSPYVPTILAACALVALHWGLAFLAFRNRKLGVLIKGKKSLLIKDGELNWENMKRTQITENDIKEALRQGGSVDLANVKYAFLERSGDISIILDS